MLPEVFLFPSFSDHPVLSRAFHHTDATFGKVMNNCSFIIKKAFRQGGMSTWVHAFVLILLPEPVRRCSFTLGIGKAHSGIFIPQRFHFTGYGQFLWLGPAFLFDGSSRCLRPVRCTTLCRLNTALSGACAPIRLRKSRLLSSKDFPVCSRPRPWYNRRLWVRR